MNSVVLKVLCVVFFVIMSGYTPALLNAQTQENAIRTALLDHDYAQALRLHKETEEQLPRITAKDVALRFSREAYMLWRQGYKDEAIAKRREFFKNLPQIVTNDGTAYTVVTSEAMTQCLTDPKYYKTGQIIGNMYLSHLVSNRTGSTEQVYPMTLALVVLTFVYNRISGDEEQSLHAIAGLELLLQGYHKDDKVRQHFEVLLASMKYCNERRFSYAVKVTEKQPVHPSINENDILTIPFIYTIKITPVTEKGENLPDNVWNGKILSQYTYDVNLTILMSFSSYEKETKIYE